jgi:hypothetical protein
MTALAGSYIAAQSPEDRKTSGQTCDICGKFGICHETLGGFLCEVCLDYNPEPPSESKLLELAARLSPAAAIALLALFVVAGIALLS